MKINKSDYELTFRRYPKEDTAIQSQLGSVCYELQDDCLHRLANGILVVKLSTDERKNVECALTVCGSSNNLVIVRNGGTCHPYEICITDLPIARNVCFPEDVIHLKGKKIQLNQQRKTGGDKITG